MGNNYLADIYLSINFPLTLSAESSKSSLLLIVLRSWVATTSDITEINTWSAGCVLKIASHVVVQSRD